MFALLLWAIAGALIVAVITAVGILCTSVRINVIFDTEAQPAFLVKAAVFGGLLPVVSMPHKRRRRSPKRSVATPSHKPLSSRRRKFARFAPRMLRECPSLISKIVERVKLERVEANIRFGLSDPADTGALYGVLLPLLQSINISQQTNVVLHPDFGNQVFGGRGHMGARFVPITLIAAMLSFAWATMILPRLSGAFR